MKPKISILVAAYNVAEYLDQCLDSIVGQTYSNLEIIIVDDGSTDATGAICDHFKKADKRVKVIHQANGGLSAARNAGLKAAKGDFVMFVDGDDFIKPDMVQKLCDASVDADVVICGYQIFPGSENIRPEEKIYSGEAATIDLLTNQEDYMVVSWNKLYKRELFDGIIFPLGKKHEDNLTTYKIFPKAKKVVCISDPLYYYVQRKNSIMQTVSVKEHLDIKMEAAIEAKEYFKDEPKFLAAAEIAELLAVFAFINNIISGKLSGDLKPYFAWLKENKQTLFKNQFASTKLKTYIKLATTGGGTGYRLFRKIKND